MAPRPPPPPPLPRIDEATMCRMDKFPITHAKNQVLQDGISAPSDQTHTDDACGETYE